MKLDNIRKFLYNHYINNFLVNHPTVPTRYVNNRYDPEEADKVIINLEDKPVRNQPLALGSKKQRLYGALVVSGTAPKDSGTKELNQYISEIGDIFWGLNSYVAEAGYLTVEEITYNSIEEYRGVYTLALAVHYRIDGC